MMTRLIAVATLALAISTATPGCSALQGTTTPAEWEARAVAAEAAAKAAATATAAAVPPPLGEILAGLALAAGAVASAYFHGRASNGTTTPKTTAK